jgi:hypothetical protein
MNAGVTWVIGKIRHAPEELRVFSDHWFFSLSTIKYFGFRILSFGLSITYALQAEM